MNFDKIGFILMFVAVFAVIILLLTRSNMKKVYDQYRTQDRFDSKEAIVRLPARLISKRVEKGKTLKIKQWYHWTSFEMKFPDKLYTLFEMEDGTVKELDVHYRPTFDQMHKGDQGIVEMQGEWLIRFFNDQDQVVIKEAYVLSKTYQPPITNSKLSLGESYILHCKIGTSQESFAVKKEDYNRVRQGDRVKLKFQGINFLGLDAKNPHI